MKAHLLCFILIVSLAAWTAGTAVAGEEAETGTAEQAEGGGGGEATTTTPGIEGDLSAARRVFEQAEQAYRDGQYVQAATFFQQAYEAARHPAFIYNAGQSLFRAGRWQDALDMFRRYVLAYEGPGPHVGQLDPLAHIRIAECLHHLNRRDEVTGALRGYLQADPQGDLAQAVRRCIDEDQPPGSIGARDPQAVQAARRIHDEAAGLHRQGRDRQAAERFLDGYRQHSEISEFLYNAATCYRSARMWEDAIREYERYVMTTCPAADAFVELAQCYHQRADYQRAIDAYRRYLQRAPSGTFAQDAREYIQSMTTVLEMSREQPAREAIARASEHFDRGSAHYAAGRYRQALQEFSQAHDLAPTRETQYNIGMCYYRMRDWLHTLTTFENYLRDGDSGEHAIAHLLAAEAELELERPGNAQRHIQDYLSRADAQELPNEENDRRTAQRLQERVRQALAPTGGGS